MEVDRSAFRWDRWSDQPATIDRRTRRKLRRLGLRDEPRKWLACLSSMPAILKSLRARRPFEAYRNDDGIGLCINPVRGGGEGSEPVSAARIAEIIGPLNLRRVAIRIPLHDFDRIEGYLEFIRSFSKYEVTVVILQDRECVEDRRKLEASLDYVFSALSGVVERYQIGNAVNRLKWGFVSQREYLEFFQVAWELRNRRYPDLELLGGSVIDFDLQEHCGSLFNPLPFRYDGYASLLYVDRRGAPESRQLGFDLLGKIEVLRRLAADSGKLPSRKTPPLWITEVNWPLLDTGRFAPSLDDCRVGESEQLFFLVRYFLLVLASGAVSACFWHQLVAPGYGLIDSRGGVLRKRPAFRGFSTLCRLFNGADIESFGREAELGYYRLTARRDGAEIVALWRSGGESSIPMPADKRAVGIEGEALDLEAGQAVTIGDSVVYLIDA